MTNPRLFKEDLVCIKNHPDRIARVLESFHDPDDGSEDWINNGHLYSTVNGRPLKAGQSRILWLKNRCVDVFQDDALVLLHRIIMQGDHVRPFKMQRRNASAKLGQIVSVKHVFDLKSTWEPNLQMSEMDSTILDFYTNLEPMAYVMYRNWLGRIQEIGEQVHLQFPNGSICIPSHVHHIEPIPNPQGSKHYNTELVPGAPVHITIQNMKRAEWIQGQMPSVQGRFASAIVLKTIISQIEVKWFACNPVMEGPAPTPAPIIRLPELDQVHVLDNFPEMHFDQVVKIKDFALFQKKVPSHFTALQNSFIITRLKTKVNVQWQDGTVEQDVDSVDLARVLSLDEHELFPSDCVSQKLAHGETRLGIVQSADVANRVCKVKWIDQETRLCHETANDEEVSFYEVHVEDEMQFASRSLVLRTAGVEPGSLCWAGEVGQRQKNGSIQVFWCKGQQENVPPHQLLNLNQHFDASPGESSNEDDDDEDDDYEIKVHSDTEEEPMEWSDADEEATQEPEMDLSVFHKSSSSPERKRTKTKDSETEAEESESSGWETVSSSDVDLSEVPNKVNENNHITIPSDSGIVPDALPRTKNDFPVFIFVVHCHHDSWERFRILETTPSTHRYLNNAASSVSRSFSKRMQTEYQVFQSSLPDGILVRVFEDHMDLLCSLIVGPAHTPYQGCLFYFELKLPSTYPLEPPLVHYHCWTDGLGKLNPNLYEDGKVCLSLLGTWSGNRQESWNENSTLLQVLVSIQGLVLVREPYYNEASFDRFSGTMEGLINSIRYNEHALLLSLKSVSTALRRSPELFQEAIIQFYFRKCFDSSGQVTNQFKHILGRMKALIARTEALLAEGRGQLENDTNLVADMRELPYVSRGCLVMLKRALTELEKLEQPLIE